MTLAPIRVLIVDDKRSSVEPVEDLIRQREFEVKIVDFDQFEGEVVRYAPDIVVIDLRREQNGELGNGEPGNDVTRKVWTQYSCPIVIYSALPELATIGPEEHPLVRHVKKGFGSEESVLHALEELRPYAEAMRKGHDENRLMLAAAMRDAAVQVLTAETSPDQQVDALFRAARRRYAAALDDTKRQSVRMMAWEQYLVPPLSPDLLLGDILRRRVEKPPPKSPKQEKPRELEKSDEREFVLILSPSCDLARRSDGQPGVQDVLVACCSPITKDASSTFAKRKLRSRLPSLLNQGHFDSVLPLPEMGNLIPPMVAQLKRLRVIPYASIAREGGAGEYERVASMDSPFRELVSWAYLQVAARPGLPDRDVRAWTAEIMRELSKGGSKAP